MDDFNRKFLPRFTALARERIRMGMQVATSIDGDQALHLARELHSLAGEAGLLGLAPLLVLARTAEEAATQLHASREAARRVALKQALVDLQYAVAAVERELETPAAGSSNGVS